MSLNKKSELIKVAKVVCGNLRKNSTEAEKLLWEEVRNKRFIGKKFYRQYPFFYDIKGKESFFIVDFYCHSEKLIIELDGKYYNYKLKEDKDRAQILNYLDLKLIRFKNDEVIDNLNEVMLRIEKKMLTK